MDRDYLIAAGRVDKINRLASKWNYTNLRNIRRRIRGDVKKSFDEMIEVLNEYFPDRWDIQLRNMVHLKEELVVNDYGYYEYNYSCRAWTWETNWLRSQSSNVMMRRSGLRSLNNIITKAPVFKYGVSAMNVTRFNIILHYPIITITNSRGASKELKDMYISLGVRVEDTHLVIETMMGARTTFTLGEYMYGYSHSHLPGISNFSGANTKVIFKDFCTGGGDVTVSRMAYGVDNNRELLEAFFLMIETYLSWESLEGGPYRYIDQSYILKKIEGTRLEELGGIGRMIATRIESIMLSRLPEHFDVPLEWEIDEGGYKVRQTREMDTFISTNCGNTQVRVAEMAGEYYDYKITQQGDVVVINERAPYLDFRGQKVRAKVIPEEVIRIPENTLIIHPIIYHYVNKRLKTIINNKITDEAAIREIS